MVEWVINAAYGMSLLALAVRDVLWLRWLLLGAQVLFLAWGALIEHLPTMLWNGLFLLINSAMIIRLLWERRPVALPTEVADLHAGVFPDMRPRDFLQLLELGNPHRSDNSHLVREGEVPPALQLVLDGQAKVQRNGQTVATVGRGAFVAEMSLLTGDPASADVVADGPVAYLSWSHRKLAYLARTRPELHGALQQALGRDLARKAQGR